MLSVRDGGRTSPCLTCQESREDFMTVTSEDFTTRCKPPRRASKKQSGRPAVHRKHTQRNRLACEKRVLWTKYQIYQNDGESKSGETKGTARDHKWRPRLFSLRDVWLPLELAFTDECGGVQEQRVHTLIKTHRTTFHHHSARWQS